MARKATEQVRVNTTRYLDEDGLDVLWVKIKEYVDEHSVTVDGGDINLSNYVTKEQLEEALANIDTSDIDLSGYVTTEVLAEQLLNYATKEYVTTAINNASLGGDSSNIDLSIYATNKYVNEQVGTKANIEHTHTVSDITDYTEPNLSEYAKITDLPNLDEYVRSEDMPNLDNYAKLTDIPSLEGYATETYVDNVIANIPSNGGENVDLSKYPTRDEMNSAIADAQLEGAEVDLSSYAKTDGKGIVQPYEIDGTRLNVELPAIPITSTGNIEIVTNFNYELLYLTNAEVDANGRNIKEYHRHIKDMDNTIVPEEGETLGFKDYLFTEVDYDFEGTVTDIKGTVIQQFASGEPFGKTLKIVQQASDLGSYPSGTYVTGYHGLLSVNDNANSPMNGMKYDYYNGYYYYNHPIYTFSFFKYLYKISSNTTVSGKYTISGFDEDSFYFLRPSGWAGNRDNYGSDRAYEENMYRAPVIALNAKNGFTINSKTEIGSYYYVLSNTELEDIHVLEGTVKYEDAINNEIVESGDFNAIITLKDVNTDITTTYTFQLPNKANYNGTEYIRYGSGDLYKRYDYRDLTESPVYKGLADFDNIPTVGWVERGFDMLREELSGDSIDLSEYALKTEIPDTSGFLTSVPEEYVTETELDAKGYLTEHQDLSNYYNKEEVSFLIDEKLGVIENGTY